MQVVPLSPIPSQVVNVVLGNQACTLKVYQKLTGVYLELYINGILIVGAIICEDRNRLVRSIYFGFIGDLCFMDNQGITDPEYTGFGDRYSLMYLETTDPLPALP